MFFHTSTIVRSKRNQIICLRDEQGVWQSDLEVLKSMIIEFHKELNGREDREINGLRWRIGY